MWIFKPHKVFKVKDWSEWCTFLKNHEMFTQEEKTESPLRKAQK